MATPRTILLKRIANALHSVPKDVVAIEISPDEMRAVRMQRSRDGITIEAVLRTEGYLLEDDGDSALAPLTLPTALRARHAGFTYSGSGAVAKAVTIAGSTGAITHASVAEAIGGVSRDTHRLGFRLLREGTRRQGNLILAAAIPESVAAACAHLLPTGRPGPYALETAPVSLMANFLGTSGNKEASCACVHFDTHTTVFAFFSEGLPQLVRTLELGSNAVLARIQRKLGVDRETADDIVMAGAFDVSAPVGEIMAPLLRQLMLSRDFVERHGNPPVSSIHVCGGGILSSVFAEQLSATTRLEARTWNPFEGTTLRDGVLPEQDLHQEWRYAAAIGCGMGITGARA